MQMKDLYQQTQMVLLPEMAHLFPVGLVCPIKMRDKQDDGGLGREPQGREKEVGKNGKGYKCALVGLEESGQLCQGSCCSPGVEVRVSYSFQVRKISCPRCLQIL